MSQSYNRQNCSSKCLLRTPTSVMFAWLLLCLPATGFSLTPDEWASDIRELVGYIKSTHPEPFSRTTELAFDNRAKNIGSRVGVMSDAGVAVELMALTASLRDGHTTLHPTDPTGFNLWLPLSFYWFADGVAVVSAHPNYKQLIGAKLTAIGDLPIEDALARVTELIGSDNDYGRRQNVFYLASVEALLALDVIELADSVTLRFTGREGGTISAEVVPVRSAFVLDETRFWGEMYAALARELLADFELPLTEMNLSDYSRATFEDKSGLPLHFRHRRAYWYTYLPAQSTVYLQLNHVTSSGRDDYESFEAFYRHVFDFVEANEVEKFILDIRYNSGGDGSILVPFVHEFIRSDKLRRNGRLFTIVGRKTYSAATMLLDLMLKHTPTVLVGEPAGSALNSYGDPRTLRLTHSGMTLNVSSEYWKLVHSAESPSLTPIDMPALMTISDYFSGRDPAVDQILALDGPYRRLHLVLAEEGGEAATSRFVREQASYGQFAWWRPFDESTFRKVARRLIREDRVNDGLAGFEILVAAYPQSWRAWRDYGKACLAIGKQGEARENLRKAKEINPGDPEVNELLANM